MLFEDGALVQTIGNGRLGHIILFEPRRRTRSATGSTRSPSRAAGHAARGARRPLPPNEPGAEDSDEGAEKRAGGDEDEDARVVVSCV